MYPPHFAGDPRHRTNFKPLPAWFIRDMGARIYDVKPKRRWHLPIWPGVRLELRLISVKGANHV